MQRGWVNIDTWKLDAYLFIACDWRSIISWRFQWSKKVGWQLLDMNILYCKPNYSTDILIKEGIYKGESKVLQYFVDMRHNLAALYAFNEVVKVMNHTGLWDTELAWYFLSRVHVFWPTWLSRFLQPEQNLLNHLLWSTALWPFELQIFFGPVWIHKA